MFALLANLIGISREKPGRKLPFVYIRRFTLFSFDSRPTITAPHRLTLLTQSGKKEENGDIPGKTVKQREM